METGLKRVDHMATFVDDRQCKDREEIEEVVRHLKKQLGSLDERMSTLEEANVEKEGRINELEETVAMQGVLIESMEARLCRCGQAPVAAPGTPENPIEVGDEDEELEYAEEYHTPAAWAQSM